MHPPGVGGRGWIAYPMPGVHMFYRIQKKFANGKFMAHFPTHVHDFDTLEAAQASCNEDWRARVLGCVDER
jgi:hypothetical protein